MGKDHGLFDHLLTINSLLTLASATLGMGGTWLMSRRYAEQLWRSLFYAAVSPLLFLFGQGAHVRDFFRAKISANRDLPESISDMVLGLSFLFWAFFLQLILLFLPEHP